MLPDSEIAKALRCGMASSISWRTERSTVTARPPVLIHGFKDPDEGARNGIVHQLRVVGAEPLPETAYNLGRQGRLIHRTLRDNLRALEFVRCILLNLGH
jgi:hypothetical protein